MKAPSIFSCLYHLPSYCFLQSNPSTLGFSDLPPAPPAERIFISEDTHTKLFATEPVALPGGIILLKGRITNSDIAGIPNADLVPGSYEGGLKLSECATDLVDTLRREIQDGQLSFRGKRVLELGCGHGLPGIFACIKGASTVHFQDFNAEVLRRLTIPNVDANLDYARARISRHNGGSSSPLTPTRATSISPELQFFSGDWADLEPLLSTPTPPEQQQQQHQQPFNLILDQQQQQQNNPTSASADQQQQQQQPSSELEFSFNSRPSTPSTPLELSRPSTPSKTPRRRSSGSRAFESSSRECSGYQGGGYDIILMSDTVYSSFSLPKLYDLIKKCLRPYYGVVYVSARKHYFGRGGGSRQFKNMVEDDGVFGAHLVAEFPDSSTREVWKFFFR